MIAAPGSMLWLLRHELRLLWRSAGKKIKLPIGALVVFAFIQLFALLMAFAIRELPPIPANYAVLIRMAASVGATMVLLMMISGALVACTQAIYARGDMNLMLSSPLEPRSIVLVRAGAIAITIFGGFAILILPFANAFGLLVSPKWFAGYPVLACLSLLATAAGLMVVLGLFRLIGPRRTRVFAQILGGVFATAAVVMMQLPNAMSSQSRDAATQWLSESLRTIAWPSPDSPVWWPARAVLGEPLPLVAAVVLSVAIFVLVAGGLADRFIASMVAASGTASLAGRRKNMRRRFNTSTVSVLRRKELNLIRRDPWLLTQILQQTVFVIPLIFSGWKFGIAGAPAMWLVLVLVAGNLAGAFGWLAASAEDAPELIATAPLQPFEVLRAKLEATLLPVALLLLAPIAAAWSVSALLGQTLALCCAGAAVSAAMLQIANPIAGRRSEFNQRAKGRLGIGLAEFALSAAWAATGGAMLYHPAFAVIGLILLAFPANSMRQTWRAGTLADAAA